MNVLNITGIGPAGAAATGALPPAFIGGLDGWSPAGEAASPGSAAVRDVAIAETRTISTSVNTLARAAAAQTATASDAASSSDPDPLVGLPPLPQLPTPQKPPPVPTDDHGQSNIVFADTGGDGALIH